MWKDRRAPGDVERLPEVTRVSSGIEVWAIGYGDLEEVDRIMD